jgi:hypothetical protein
MRTFADIKAKMEMRQITIATDGQDVTRSEGRDKGKWREEKYAFCEL